MFQVVRFHAIRPGEFFVAPNDAGLAVVYEARAYGAGVEAIPHEVLVAHGPGYALQPLPTLAKARAFSAGAAVVRVAVIRPHGI